MKQLAGYTRATLRTFVFLCQIHVKNSMLVFFLSIGCFCLLKIYIYVHFCCLFRQFNRSIAKHPHIQDIA